MGERSAAAQPVTSWAVVRGPAVQARGIRRSPSSFSLIDPVSLMGVRNRPPAASQTGPAADSLQQGGYRPGIVVSWLAAGALTGGTAFHSVKSIALSPPLEPSTRSRRAWPSAET